MNYKYLLKKDSEYINLELKRISDGIISKKRNEPWSDELVKLLSFDEFYFIAICG